jgi:hypothetical protein
MDASAPLVVGARRDIVLFSPAPVQFCTVHLFTGGSGIAGRDDRIVFIDDDSAEIAPQAGTLVGTPQRKVKEVMVPVRSHLKENIADAGIKEVWFDLTLIKKRPPFITNNRPEFFSRTRLRGYIFRAGSMNPN